MASTTHTEFNRWKQYLWPVHRSEYPKLLPMLFLFFFVSLNYNILRTLKDSLLITAKSSGAEVIPFVKVWAMFPGALFFTFLYTRLARRFSRETVFYILISLFLFYFTLFTLVFYPLRDYLHPHAFADMLTQTLPTGCKGLIAMIRYWSFTFFYVMSEMWGTMILFVLLWGFANQMTQVEEAKRFYGLFGIGANCSGIFAGQISSFLCREDVACYAPFGNTLWEQTLVLLVGLILFSGIMSIALFRWLHVRVLSYEPVVESKEPKHSPSFRENFRYLLTSKYLISIAAIVVAYNMVINLTEVMWKHQVRELYPNPSDYTYYMNQIVSLVGVIATVASLVVSGNSIRKLGWTFTALLTPFILLITTVTFFGSFLLKEHPPHFLLSFVGMTSGSVVLFWGTLQNVMSRAAKYTVFDETKEMAFIPLNEEAKVMGKAAIDGVCSRLGKSGGACIYQGLLLCFSTIAASSFYVGVVILFLIGGWVYAGSVLGRKFGRATEEKELLLREAV